MFTGIVQGMRPVVAITDLEGGRKIRIQLDDLSENLKIGASVAVNGVCLTAVKVEEGWAEFDIIQESLNRTNLGSLETGSKVDIERACQYGAEVGGHQVTGHVDCTGKITEIRKSPNNQDVVINCGSEWTPYLISKGWIAMDGISLTVVDVNEESFSVSLIPETLNVTVLGQKAVNDTVNLEFDQTTKVIVKTLDAYLPQIEARLLAQLKS